jgi:hypothetical protein
MPDKMNKNKKIKEKKHKIFGQKKENTVEIIAGTNVNCL